MTTTNTTINLTDNAKRHIENILVKEKQGIGLRLSVKATGCSGYQYVVAVAKAVAGKDRMFTANGVKVIIDEQSLPYLTGVKVDFVRDGLNAGFKFDNPNVVESCGCGESFSVKQLDN